MAGNSADMLDVVGLDDGWRDNTWQAWSCALDSLRGGGGRVLFNPFSAIHISPNRNSYATFTSVGSETTY